MRLIAVMNQKGGVGKTTTSLNLSHALAMSGKKVTVIDMDPQAQLTMSLGINQQGKPGVAGVLLSGLSLRDVMVEARDGLQLIPAGVRLGEMENLTKGGAQRGWLLHKAIREHLDDQDYVLLDCPPSAGMLAMNALFAAEEILIPVSGDYLGLHGVSRLIAVLKHIETALEQKKSKWIVVTRYNERRKLARDVREKLVQYFNNRVLNTVIRENISLAESPSFGKTIFDYQRKSKGAEDYLALAFELLEGKAKLPS